MHIKKPQISKRTQSNLLIIEDFHSILKINFYESQLYTNMANPVFYSKHLKFFTTEITERTEISIK